MSAIRSKSFPDAQLNGRSAAPPPPVPGALQQEAWVLTDGSVGMEAQGLAVAEAVGLPFRLRRVRVGGVRGLVSAPLQLLLRPIKLLASVESDTHLEAPWPRLVISIGRRSVPIALAVKRLSGAFAAHIQNPKVPARLFDLVAAPLHDDFTGPNVITTFGAVHRVSPDRIAAEGERFAPKFADLPQPRVAVLLGGTSQAFSFDAGDAEAFGAKLAALARTSGASLLVTPSRRTEPAALAALSKAIANVPHYVWDGTGENPYLALLGLADTIVVTGDSVNMVTEAAGTGKPVYVHPLRGRSRRLSRFHDLMRERGATRPFDGTIESWTYPPINDTELVAAAIRGALNLEPQP